MALTATTAVSRASGAGPLAYERVAGEVVAGRYELLRPLGRGGMGEVWAARDGVLKTEVAMKFLSRELDEQLAEHLRERFRFEAQVSALLARATEDIARVHDAGSDAHSPYLVMELVAGRSLERVIDDGGALSVASFLPIYERICGALEVAHAHGIAHRDIKPGNVLIGASHRGELRVKLTDFGIAKGGLGHLPLDRPKDTREGFVVGSPDYMAPEQLKPRQRTSGEPSTESSSERRLVDLWSVGVLAYEALTGKMPFSARTMPEMILAITTGNFLAPTSLVHTLPPAVDGWFERALAKDPAQRFGSAREMAETLRAALQQQPLPVSSPQLQPGQTRPARRRWWALAALALGVCTAAAAVVFNRTSDVAPTAAALDRSGLAGTMPSAPAAPPTAVPSAPVAAPAPPQTAPLEPPASAAPIPRPSAAPAPRRRPPGRSVDPNPDEPSATF